MIYSTERLLACARDLHRAETHHDVLERVLPEVRAALGSSGAWLFVPASGGGLRRVAVVGADGPAREGATDDARHAAVAAGADPVVVVAPHTLLVPLRLDGALVGVLGLGGASADDLDAPAPGAEALAWLAALGDQVAAAVARVCADGVRRDAEEHLRRSEEQLFDTQRMEAVGQLASSVAHDLNNMLSVILGEADVAGLDVPATSPAQDSLRAIVDAAQRTAGLARRLLAFSRRQVFRPRRLSLAAVVRGIEPTLRRLAGPHTELEVRLYEPLWETMIDEGQLAQVLVNLVVNARDAMPGGGHMTVAAQNTTRFEAAGGIASERRFVSLVVHDSGMGMDDATRARIFEPFFSTKAPGQGTGLGLSTVAGIVKQHGATIHVTSEPGRGATFTIELPASDDVAAIDRAIGTLAAEAMMAATEHDEREEGRA